MLAEREVISVKQNRPSLKLITDKRRRDNGRELRQVLFQRCRAAADQMGDEIAGFAVVVWDRRGDVRSSYEAAQGPIGPALVPTLVSDALNRHIAVVLAEERVSGSSEQ